MTLRRPARNGQPKAVAGTALARRAEEGRAQLLQVLAGDSRAMVANTQQYVRSLALHADNHGLVLGAETQSIAQQVVERALEHVRPAFEVCCLIEIDLQRLLRRGQACVLLQLAEQCAQIDRL